MHSKTYAFRHFGADMGEPLLSVEERGASDNINTMNTTADSVLQADIGKADMGSADMGNAGREGSGRSECNECSRVDCMQADGVVPFAPDADADVCLPLALTCSAAYAAAHAMLRSGLSASGQCLGRCWEGQFRGLQVTGPYLP